MSNPLDVRFRLSTAVVVLSWDETQELRQRLDAQGRKGALDAIDLRIPAGVVFTQQQKIDVWNVIHDWLEEVAADELGNVLGLREAIEGDVPEIGRHDANEPR
jgi:hypothetical protein